MMSPNDDPLIVPNGISAMTTISALNVYTAKACLFVQLFAEELRRKCDAGLPLAGLD